MDEKFKVDRTQIYCKPKLIKQISSLKLSREVAKTLTTSTTSQSNHEEIHWKSSPVIKKSTVVLCKEESSNDITKQSTTSIKTCLKETIIKRMNMKLQLSKKDNLKAEKCTVQLDTLTNKLTPKLSKTQNANSLNSFKITPSNSLETTNRNGKCEIEVEKSASEIFHRKCENEAKKFGLSTELYPANPILQQTAKSQFGLPVLKSSLRKICDDSNIYNDLNDTDEDAEFEALYNKTIASLILEFGNIEVPTEPNKSALNLGWPARYSMFPHIPPYIFFSNYEDSAVRIPHGKRLFLWKYSSIMPLLARKIVTNTGFVLTKESTNWMGIWGKHLKCQTYKSIRLNQKINHFPGTFHLGRKDRLWRNILKMIRKFGGSEFGFVPYTYILPHELPKLKENFGFVSENSGDMWIIKPPASARGDGVKVLNKWTDLPKGTPLIVQKYITNPYLINDNKFDLRLYVLLTSYDPLRIYLYPEGLVRFASSKYNKDDKNDMNIFMHLTNYSINKKSEEYIVNENADDCNGHKWTLTKFFEYLQNKQINTRLLWLNLQDLVIKTIISSEGPITEICKEHLKTRYTSYELFGLDVLLDENLKPWLLEVNISPSLHKASSLDIHVKAPMIRAILNMAQFHFPQILSTNLIRQWPQFFDARIYTKHLTRREKTKHDIFSSIEAREEYLTDILAEITGDDIRVLAIAEDELLAKGNFERIFPTQHTYKYFPFLHSKYYNMLFDAWENKYHKNRESGIARLQGLCAKKLHLKVASVATEKSRTSIEAEAESINKQIEVNTRSQILRNESVISERSTNCAQFMGEVKKLIPLRMVV